jgi:hypothetical protein|nr:MAG TPA: Minor capsid protein from bacteriophage [Caudoviricetes sp.]
MSIIEALQKYIKACPLLKSGKINVDNLAAEPVRYCIESVPCQPVIRRYVDGASVNQYIFVLASRECYGQEVRQNIDNSAFYEQLVEWIEEQNKTGNLPKLGDGRTAQRIEILSSGYLFDATSDTAQYQLQMRLIYYKQY